MEEKRRMLWFVLRQSEPQFLVTRQLVEKQFLKLTLFLFGAWPTSTCSVFAFFENVQGAN